MIVLHASFPIKPDKMDEALELADHPVEESNQELGVIGFHFNKTGELNVDALNETVDLFSRGIGIGAS
jgi:quinol monooxygenase YgiN